MNDCMYDREVFFKVRPGAFLITPSMVHVSDMMLASENVYFASFRVIE